MPAKLLTLLLFICFYLQLFEVYAETGFRKYAGEFMSIDVSPRSQAMGGSFIAVANDVSAAFHNPAGLVQIQSMQAAIMHTWQFTNLVNYDYIGFTHPFSQDKAFAISLIRLGVDDIKDSRNAKVGNGENWRIDPSLINKFNSADYVLMFSLGKLQSERFMWGLNFKLIRRDLAESNATGLGFDAGIIYKLNQKFQLGFVARNVTTTLIAWNTGENELVRPTFLLGTSYKVPFHGIQSYFIPTVDFTFRTESYPQLLSGLNNSEIFAGAIGGEFVFREVLFLRGGIDEINRPNFGIGIRIPHVNIDYAFSSFDQELGNSHRVGLIIDFNRK
jgi:hypothetical protein